MLRFSEFLREEQVAGYVPNTRNTHLGMSIEPEEEEEYRSIVAKYSDNPDTPAQEMPTGNLGWQETNAAVSNYQKQQLDKIRAMSGL